MSLNVTVATFPTGCNTAVAQPSLVQWDRGQILQFEGIELPTSYQVEFTTPETVLAIPMIGDSGGVEIPNVLLQSSAPITAYLVLHEGEDDRETKYWATIHVKPRQMPPITEPDPEQADIIDQAIAALQQGVSDAQGYAEGAAGSAEEAEAAKEAIQDMNATAQGAAAGTQPTVEKTVDPETGAVTLHFTLPAGADGYSPAVSITEISGGHRVTITDSEHQGGQSFDVMNGVSVTGAQLNNDYTLTLTFSDGNSWTSPISIRGATGATPAFSIGTVTTGAAGSSAAVTITGTAENPVLNLTIPKGDPGEVPAAAIAPTESSTTASRAYAAGDYFWLSGTLYQATAAIAQGSTITAGTNCQTAQIGPDVTTLKNQIIAIKDTEGMLYKGTPANNDILFTSSDVSVGDIIYWSMTLSEEKASFIGLYNSSDTRIGLLGRSASDHGNLSYYGTFDVPTGFSYAKFSSSGGTVTIPYISKYRPPEIEDIYDKNLISPINHYPASAYALNKGLKTNGSASTLNGAAVTDFISVMPGDLVMRSENLGSSTYGLCFYDLNQTYVSGLVGNIAAMCFVVPDGVYYLRDTVNHSHTSLAINIFRGNEIKQICGNLYKKKAYTFGDSITWYDGRLFTWGKFQGKIAVGYQSYMRRVGMTVVNKGTSGDDITEINPDIHATDFTDADYVTITSGANDSKDNVPIGTLADIGATFNTSTFYGALQDAVEYILGQKQTVKIVLMTPIKGTIYPDGEVKKEIVTAIKAVGDLYGLPVCDWYNTSGINKLTFGEYINDPDDNTQYMFHPTNSGFKRMADIFIPFLKDLETDPIPQSFP